MGLKDESNQLKFSIEDVCSIILCLESCGLLNKSTDLIHISLKTLREIFEKSVKNDL
jgi:hypothetical protein